MPAFRSHQVPLGKRNLPLASEPQSGIMGTACS